MRRAPKSRSEPESAPEPQASLCDRQVLRSGRVACGGANPGPSTIKKSPTSCDAEPSVREAVPFGGPQARPSSGLMGHHHSGPSTRHF